MCDAQLPKSHSSQPTLLPIAVAPNTALQGSTVAGIAVGIIVAVVILALIPAVVGYAIVWGLCRRRRDVELGPNINFATKDYTDEDNVTELDDAAD